MKVLERHLRHSEKYIGTNAKGIYITNLTRKQIVSFESEVQYFGGKLLMLLPHPNIQDEIQLQKFVEYFNSEDFRNKHIFSGRFKIGQRELLNVDFPDFC